jgi:hypothetical protein
LPSASRGTCHTPRSSSMKGSGWPSPPSAGSPAGHRPGPGLWRWRRHPAPWPHPRPCSGRHGPPAARRGPGTASACRAAPTWRATSAAPACWARSLKSLPPSGRPWGSTRRPAPRPPRPPPALRWPPSRPGFLPVRASVAGHRHRTPAAGPAGTAPAGPWPRAPGCRHRRPPPRDGRWPHAGWRVA